MNMKNLPLFLMFVITSTVFGDSVPTPDKAVTIAFNLDNSVEWAMASMNGNSQKIIAEFTPKGQPIQAWQEMVAQEITFTKKKLSKHFKDWKKMVTDADPNIEIEELQKDDDSMTVVYKSKTFNEYSIRRFMGAKDGVYALAYHIRLNRFNEDRVTLWKSIIAKSELIPNPNKK